MKLSSFILKHQPKKGKKDKSTKKAERRARKARNAENGTNGHDSDNGSPDGNDNSDGNDENGDGDMDGSDDELNRRMDAESKVIDDVHEEKEIQWSVDVSEEAVKARAKSLPDDLKRSLVIEDDDEADGEGNPYEQLGTWIETTAADEGGVDKLDSVEIYKKAAELGVEKKHKTLTVLAQALFDDAILKQIEPRAAMLKKMITSERHEKAFLGGTERFVGVAKPNLIPAISSILMQYYEFDLVSEETLKGWGSKASKKYVDVSTSRKVRKSAEKFMTWLETAESDEDEDEDEDDE